MGGHCNSPRCAATPHCTLSHPHPKDLYRRNGTLLDVCKEQEARIAELLEMQGQEDRGRVQRERRLTAVETQMAHLQRTSLEWQEKLLQEQSEREALAHEVTLHEERYALLQRKHTTMRERCQSLEATCRDLLRASASSAALESPGRRADGRQAVAGDAQDMLSRPVAPLQTQPLRHAQQPRQQQPERADAWVRRAEPAAYAPAPRAGDAPLLSSARYTEARAAAHYTREPGQADAAGASRSRHPLPDARQFLDMLRRQKAEAAYAHGQ